MEQIKKAFVLNCLYINGIKANKEDFTRLKKEIENGTPYTIEQTKTKTNILID